MQNYKATIQYDGTKYNGWQIQRNGGVTIQGKISDVLTQMVGNQVDVVGSGRTDAGVHALGQVANFFVPEKFDAPYILDYLNRYLPEDIAVVIILKKIPNIAHVTKICIIMNLMRTCVGDQPRFLRMWS